MSCEHTKLYMIEFDGRHQRYPSCLLCQIESLESKLHGAEIALRDLTEAFNQQGCRLDSIIAATAQAELAHEPAWMLAATIRKLAAVETPCEHLVVREEVRCAKAGWGDQYPVEKQRQEWVTQCGIDPARTDPCPICDKPE